MRTGSRVLNAVPRISYDHPPLGGGAGGGHHSTGEVMDRDSVRARIRIMLETGELPCDDAERTLGSRGFGRRCSACSEEISVDELEFKVELASGLTLRLHRRCHQLWLEECEPSKSA